eukprot:11217608-Lingulodinium_polyedra.AAC.1
MGSRGGHGVGAGHQGPADAVRGVKEMEPACLMSVLVFGQRGNEEGFESGQEARLQRPHGQHG